MTVEVSLHGAHRVRERIGLPKKSVQKLAESAFQRGAHPKHFSGAIRRYLDHEQMRGHSQMRVFNGYVFVFSGETFITAWALPPRYRKAKPSASNISQESAA